MKKILFALLFTLVGLQNASALDCEGKIFFKPPESWSKAYIVIQGQFIQLSMQSSGWYEIDAAKIYESPTTYFGLSSNPTWGYESEWISREKFGISGGEASSSATQEAFSCKDLASGSLYIFENPSIQGKTVISSNPPGAKYFFVMIPPEYEDWMSDIPMISMDGGATGKQLKAVPDMCGWYYYVFFNEDISDNVVLYRASDDYRTDMIGINGNWETGAATPIPLNLIFDLTDSLFFVPDEEQKTNEDGFFYSRAEVEGFEGTCSYSLAALIYDTDASLHPSFSCYPGRLSSAADGCQEGAQGVPLTMAREAISYCIGVHQGLVEDTLNPVVKKPTMSAAGAKCFLDQKFFNQLFNYTAGVNERRCFDMPFTRSADGKWEFDSDYYISPGTQATGFYPVETSGPDLDGDKLVLADDPEQTPVQAARTKRAAEGPVFLGPLFRALDPNENVPKFDLLCNGPGWSKGADCEGAFATGDESEMDFALKFVGADKYACVFGWSCEQNAPSDWTFYVSGTDTPDGTGYNMNASTSKRTFRWEGLRNQHYCFESHAHFTYNKGQKFSFRGDDDIWVYVDNKLAVDIGGTHLAAPGYVDLDSFKGRSGALVPGKQYDIDIFFCDRRTTMSNVRIKTNMYIRQKTAIDIKKTQDKSGNVSYNVCYSRTGDGSCVAALSKIAEVDSVCDDKIPEIGIQMSYTLVRGGSYTESPVVPDFENVTTPGVYKCGIDLTNIASPKINASSVCLDGGRYTLFINIEGRVQKVQSFRVTGDVDVVYEDAVVSDGDVTGLKYILQASAMGGTLVPVYVSTVDKADSKSSLEVLPNEARNISYTLTYSPLMKVYAKNGAGEYVPLASGSPRIIDMSGVDTVYATVEMADLAQSNQPFTIGVAGRPFTRTINFFKPTVMFVDKIPATTTVTGSQPDENGRFEEQAVGVVYDYYLIALKPDANGNLSPTTCTAECDGLVVRKSEETSSKIEFVADQAVFKNGYATISVRAVGEYRYSAEATANNPAKIVVEFAGRTETYSPVYFRSLPIALPVLADVFDVRGAKPAKEFDMVSAYFSKDQEYLDGIGDSIAVYYNRALHPDSLPEKLCVLWDSSSAELHNPYVEGFSTSSRENAVYCNALVSVSEKNLDCSSKNDGHCSNVITLGGLQLSAVAKTAGAGKVYSYSQFKDNDRDVVKQGFAATLTDRIAPIPLKAELYSMKNSKGEKTGRDSLILTLSEPVQLKTDSKKKEALEFYLQATTDVNAIQSEVDPVLATDGGLGKIRYVYNSEELAPSAGDYVRLRATAEKVYWADLVDLGTDTVRKATSYNWNSPTAYNEEKRLPSPWVAIVKIAESDSIGEKKNEEDEPGTVGEEFADPSFRVKMVGPFQFAIVMEDPLKVAKKAYAVLDLQGRIVAKGDITSAETVVPALSKGSYVVKVGLGMRRVNLH